MTRSTAPDGAARRVVVSVLGGRPHLVKSCIVHQAFRRPDVVHLGLRAQIMDTADYPGPWELSGLGVPPIHDLPGSADDPQVSRMERSFEQLGAGCVIVYGDLEASLNAAVAARNLGICVVHVEAGYRSGDWGDPEERTRLALNKLARVHVAHSELMAKNLLADDVPEKDIHIFENPGFRLLSRVWPQVPDLPREGRRALVTLHRPENLDSDARLRAAVDGIIAVSELMDVTFITYATTLAALRRHGDLNRLAQAPGVTLLPTSRYRDYVQELRSADLVITDSSGVQDDCYFVRTPCLVLRRATPRPWVHRAPEQVLCGPDRDLVQLVRQLRRGSLGPRTDELGPQYGPDFETLVLDRCRPRG